MFNGRIGVREIFGAIVLAIVSVGIGFAQEGPDAVQISAMRRLDFLSGEWKGSGWIVIRGGERRAFQETENIGWKADSLVMVIDGIGTERDSSSGMTRSVHNAFTVVSYDPQSADYRWEAFLATGQSTEARAWLKDDSTLVWEMDIPQMGKMRYTIKIEGGNHWNETGEMSRDGKNWTTFFGMNLTR